MNEQVKIKDMVDSKNHVLAMQDIWRSFEQGERKIDVLTGANMNIGKGECVALVGPSGAGKSTLLHIAGLLERPDSGHLFINGEDCANMNDAKRTEVRRHNLGFVYQSHRLLPEFSALENIVIPQRIAGLESSTSVERAEQLLAMLNLKDRMDHRPSQLSGGEQQRVAIARAVANAPKMLLADEPTGNLDPQTADRVFNALIALVRQSGLSALIATHNLELAGKMDRCISLTSGQIIEHKLKK